MSSRRRHATANTSAARSSASAWPLAAQTVRKRLAVMLPIKLVEPCIHSRHRNHSVSQPYCPATTTNGQRISWRYVRGLAVRSRAHPGIHFQRLVSVLVSQPGGCRIEFFTDTWSPPPDTAPTGEPNQPTGRNPKSQRHRSPPIGADMGGWEYHGFVTTATPPNEPPLPLWQLRSLSSSDNRGQAIGPRHLVPIRAI